MDRREFLKRSGKLTAGLGGLWLSGTFLASCASESDAEKQKNSTPPVDLEPLAQAPAGAVNLVVARGADAAAQLRAAVEHLGGIERFISSGQKVLIKPNAAFATTPDVAATTNPYLVGEMVAMCLAAGAVSVLVLEHTLSNLPGQCLKRSGIGEQAEAQGAKVVAYASNKPGATRAANVPAAQALPQIDLLAEVFDADVIIDMAKAKHHGSATLSLSMKNLMGLAGNMGAHHQINLHRAIAELNTIIRPRLVVLDATSILLDRGPGGPGTVANPGEVIAGTDIVAVDAYAATLFGQKPSNIGYIMYGQELGLGSTDYASVGMERVEV